jgi:outer membrane lipoprotein-sorting protein
MTRFLRTASTRRLLATIAAVVAVAVAGSAIAVAASGNGPVPAPKPLAQAVHDALAAPQVNGISARITFTNHLIDSSAIQGSDPLLTGGSGRLWLSSDHRLRVELQSDNGDAQAVVNGNSFWVYDHSSNTAYEGTLPGRHDTKHQSSHHGLPSVAEIQRDLNRLARHLNISGASPSDVAARPVYSVRVSPKQDGGLLGAAEFAWDSVHGTPLRFAVYARNQSSPVLELKATDISYGPVPASDFAISPPSGAKVVRVAAAVGRAGTREQHLAVARHLPFKLAAPTTLAGLKLNSVEKLDWQGKPAALVTYGKGLSAVAVIEQTANAQSTSQLSSHSGERPGLNLPTVSVNGTTGQELPTALGTIVHFTRGGVSYTVLGSVPQSTAELAARGL